MFEKAKPILDAKNATHSRVGLEEEASAYSVKSKECGGFTRAEEDAQLRQIDWRELSARLGAVRDLRHVLRSKANDAIEAHSGSLGEAAEQFFRAKEDDERAINLVALEQSKGSSCINNRCRPKHDATGDSRED